MTEDIKAQSADSIAREKTIIKTSIIGIIANVLLAAFKAAVGLMTHSIAIVLEATDRKGLFEAIIADVKKAFPDYELQVAMDTDFTEE